MQKRSEQNKKR